MQITTHQYKVNSILCGIVALSILIRLPFLNVPMISDEGGYAYVAYFWSSDYQLYKDIPFARPQGIFLLYKFALATFGDGVLSIRLFAAFYSALTTLSVFVVSRSLFSLPSSLISAAVFAIFSTSPSFEGFTANAELFTLLPLTLAAFFAWNRKWFLAGLLSGVASAIKPSGVAGFVLVFAHLLQRDK